MGDYLTALLFASAPALGNFGGGLVAESFDVSRRALSLALHAAAGVVLAVVAVELIPQTLSVEPPMGADRRVRRRWPVLHGR